ncbi:hypothetical protein Micbo1qcDRAFT_169436 [Microdochium bolleyi]|uniref:DUF1772-domain-containing protein n=1 Tax=Microdochium bolleyi TaxID=196109 RepID=A0A136IKF0_9PEZI|nr:hypothetical protein Micbo1qcDRAFT_169436 [Microdochium bolleyi]
MQSLGHSPVIIPSNRHPSPPPPLPSSRNIAQLPVMTPTTITLAHNLTLTALSILTGIALSLRVWTIPIIGLAHPASTAVQVRQFNHVLVLGFKYLQTSSRLIPVALLSLAGATYHHQQQPGPPLVQHWTHYLAATLVLLITAPWEVYLIFPTNDKITGYGRALDKERQGRFGDKRDDEVQRLLTEWQFWHVGRIAFPMIATLILAASGAGLLP